ncbi:MAG: SUMF1/EgtB/PvdO family nonheme iron enzyme [Treponema sp.]|jgi:hypothetical protein|nr:SUMF1/EgtB/PvdO family nonheme iron enzyme [Treponema sp.]
MFGKFGCAGKKEWLPEDRVHLKPLFGVRPGVYLAGLYGVVILIILFFVLLYPGLKNPGGLLIVTTKPEGAAIWVDGVYQAASPATVFVPQGRRRVSVSLPSFTEWREEIDVTGRAFASLLFPKKTLIAVTLETPDPAAVLNEGAAEYAMWSFAGEPTAIYQIPLSLSEAAYRAAFATQGNAAALSAMNQTLEAASRFTSTAAGARDLIRSKYLVDNTGLSPSPLTLISSAQDTLSFLSKNPDSAAALASLVPPELASVVTDSAWYKKRMANGNAARNVTQTLSADNGVVAKTTTTVGTTAVNGALFYAIPKGTLSQGNRVFTIEAFSIAAADVSPSSWEAFLAANPEWKKENIANLVSQGFATEDYLEENAETASVTGVSWYAAKAYCAWLSTFLEDADYEARLPYEQEWEYAAVNDLLHTAQPADDPAVWCEDHFAPLNAISAKSESIAAVGSPERSVRGGKYMKLESRGSLPPDFCAPFVSFRPVIAKKGMNYE